MRRLRELIFRLVGLFNKQRKDRELDDEIESYQPEYQAPMLALHRSAIEGFMLGMSQQQDEADLVSVEDFYLRNRGEFLLGFIDERLVAMGGFKWLSDGLAELRRRRIARELQGRGYGTLLLRELERRAFQSGVRTLFLDTARRRPLTLEFYRKHGYQETRDRPEFLWSCRDRPVQQDFG